MNNKIFTLDSFNKNKKNFHNKKIVLCHGVFDLMHIGHIKHFEEAKSYGEILIVSITSDKYVNKGPNRPAFSELNRALTLASLKMIDYVIINDNLSSIPVITKIKPNYYCKGPDYKNFKDDITGKIKNEVKAVKRVGGKIIYTDAITFSSSKLINTYSNEFSKEQKIKLEKIKKFITLKKLKNEITNFTNIKILIIGEIIVDEYNFCEAVGKSGKEPTLVLRDIYKEIYSGGSAAIARHLSSFSKKITLLSALGEKMEFKNKIFKDTPKNVQINYLRKSNSPTILKRRFLDHISKNKVLGVYSLNDDLLNKSDEMKFQNKLKKLIKKHDLVIVSDYGHGLISEKSAKIICDNSKFLAVNAQLNASNISFHGLRKYKGVNCVIINDRELRHELRDRNSNVKILMKKLCSQQKIKNLIVTMGTEGSIFYNKSKNKFYKNDAFSKTAVDKIGAGDTMLAIMAACLYKNFSEDLSLLVGSIAAAKSVKSIGNKYPISRNDLLKTLEHLLK